MSYKSLATFLTDPATAEIALDAAVRLARSHDAHLEVYCIGIDHTQPGFFYAGAPAIVYQETLDQARDEAHALEQAARARLEKEHLRWSADSGVAQLGGLSDLVALHGRFSDLVVQPRPYGEGRGHAAEATVEAALFEAGAPVLVVPDNGLPAGPVGRRIVIGWNQSNEALNAVRRALPMLIAAEHVNIAVVDPRPQGAERSDPGGMLCQMLVRHGVKAEVSVIARTLPGIADMLARQIRDQDADMLVMGAYGHSRLREAILGGATRNMLEHAEVPVFMAR